MHFYFHELKIALFIVIGFYLLNYQIDQLSLLFKNFNMEGVIPSQVCDNVRYQRNKKIKHSLLFSKMLNIACGENK